MIDNLNPCDIGTFVTMQDTTMRIRTIGLIATLAFGPITGRDAVIGENATDPLAEPLRRPSCPGGSLIVLYSGYFISLLATHVLIVFAYYNTWYMELLVELLRENSWYENGTVILLLISVGVCLHASFRRSKYAITKRDSLILLFMAFVLFIAALEEVSWGQTIFDFTPHQFILEHNIQKEFNLHNLRFVHGTDIIVIIIVLGFIVAPLTFYLLKANKGSWLSRWSAYVPPLSVVLLFLCSISIQPYRPMNLRELVNMLSSLIFTVGFTYLAFVQKTHTNAYTKVGCLLLLLSICLLSIYGGTLVFEGASAMYKGPWAVNPYELLEFFLSYAILVWAYWFSRRNLGPYLNKTPVNPESQ